MIAGRRVYVLACFRARLGATPVELMGQHAVAIAADAWEFRLG